MVMLFYWGVRSRLFGTEGGEGKVERREGGGVISCPYGEKSMNPARRRRIVGICLCTHP